MRDLIRPTLFIVARTGLLLAVVAWIVGQWKVAEISVGHFGLGCYRTMWSISWDGRISLWYLALRSPADSEAQEKYGELWFRRLHRSPGLAARYRWSIPWVMLRH